VSLTASGGGYDAATANMPVTVLDGDLVELSARYLSIEEGSSGTFTVGLTARPSENVSLRFVISGSNSNSDITFSAQAGTLVTGSTLTFKPSNWSQVQTVTVRVAHDVDSDDDDFAQTYFELPGGGTKLLRVDALDDEMGLTLSANSLMMDEDGSKTFTVQLAAQPWTVFNARKVTLAVTGDADVTVSPTSLDFTTRNWNVAQIVTVSAADDSDKADDTATVSLTGDGITSGSVSVTVDDDDDSSVGLTLSALEAVTEGGSKTFTVKLAAQPGNARRITLTVTGDSDITVSPASLDFTTSNWSTAQTVTVSAAQDADKADDTSTISLTGDGITSGKMSMSA
ncbi:MAG: hypothetical protein ISN29_07005, partial [Gammaproteobacteria bacterium AqS3]|nr:hypothetical protein [Gammaproteobacteria bacterium AqS3]